MVRLPLIKMASREIKRLPVWLVKNKLIADASLRVDVNDMPAPSTQHFVYHFSPLELHEDQIQHCFILVEVTGEFKERILTKGEASGISHNFASRYTQFRGVVGDIGNFNFYCPFFEMK